jgi:hypothetical protein
MIDSKYEIKTPNFEFQRAGYLQKLAADPMVVSDLSENFIEERSLTLYYHQLWIRGRLQPSATGQSISIGSSCSRYRVQLHQKLFLHFKLSARRYFGSVSIQEQLPPLSLMSSSPSQIFLFGGNK